MVESQTRPMAEPQNPLTESKTLNTELETLTPEETTAVAAATETTHTTDVADEHDVDYDMADFATALESFDREQAAEKEAAQSAMSDDTITTGTVVKITDKHVVVDIGLKSEGLIPLDQVVDHTGAPKFNVGDTVDVVVEREEP